MIHIGYSQGYSCVWMLYFDRNAYVWSTTCLASIAQHNKIHFHANCRLFMVRSATKKKKKKTKNRREPRLNTANHRKVKCIVFQWFIKCNRLVVSIVSLCDEGHSLMPKIPESRALMPWVQCKSIAIFRFPFHSFTLYFSPFCQQEEEKHYKCERPWKQANTLYPVLD